MEYFLSVGLKPPFRAAGFVGVFMVESELQPGCVQSTTGVCTGAGSKTASPINCPNQPQGRGIAQWSYCGKSSNPFQARYNGLLAFAFKHGVKGWAGVANSLKVQLEYVWHELTTNSYFQLPAIKSASNIDAVVTLVAIYYEGNKYDIPNGEIFGRQALKVYDQSR